jgi:hypothetical protein
MGKIVKQIKVSSDIGETVLTTLLDSGAGVSLIREDIAKKIFSTFTKMDKSRIFYGVNGQKAFKSSWTCILQLKMKNKLLDGQFYVVENMPRELIIGVDFMQKWEITLDLKKEDYSIGVDPEAIEIANS